MMKKIGSKVFVLLIFQLGLSASDAISYESCDQNGFYVVGRFKTCQMLSTTMISSEGVSISPVDSSVLALDLGNNRKISFLPIRVDETFPNLALYYASYCSLKTVSNLNFRNLKKLRLLSLSRNQIEKIDTDTFEDLTSLEFLHLDGNKIKQINGGVFAGLSKLININLKGNICINKNFLFGTASATTEVSKNCGFADLETISSQQNEQKFRIESLIEKVMKDNKELSIEVASLKAQLAASLSSAAVVRQQLENQISMLTTLNSKLENSWEQTCKAQTKDLTEDVQRKGDKINGLVDEQIKLRYEVNEKRTKLENLQAKLDDLNC